jgi:hypothetical protein
MPIRHLAMAAACLCVIGYAAWFAFFSAAHPAREVTLLDASLPLRSEGTTWTFTADRPGAVTLVVVMPAGCTKDGRLWVHPLHLALRPDPVYEPDPEPEHVIDVPAAGLGPTRLELRRPGAYVVRMEPIPMAMAHEGAPPEARVRIVRAP